MITLYDVTRLVSRRNSPTPTGIDRVDLRYAVFFAEHSTYKVHFILQELGSFFLIDCDAFKTLLKFLESRWLDGVNSKSLDANLTNYFSYIRLKSQIKSTLLNKPKSNFLKDNISLVDKALIKLIKTNKNTDIRYFNMSHHRLDNHNGFQGLVESGVQKLIFCIYDLIPITYPEYVKDGDMQKHVKRIESVLSLKESELITISEDSKDEIIKYAQKKNFKIPKSINVLYIGVEEHMLQQKQSISNNEFDKLKPYFLYVSTIEARKNHILLLNIWRELSKELNNKNLPKLIIVGKRGWENQSATAMLDRCDAIQNSVVEMSGLNDNKLIELYRGANAMLFPSYVEGWGMPVVEAISLGTPVICNDIKVLHEAGQLVPEYIDVMDSKKWKDTILDYIREDSNLKEKQLERMKSFEAPTWDDYFNKFENILEHDIKGIK